jgi:hypothetical protein
VSEVKTEKQKKEQEADEQTEGSPLEKLKGDTQPSSLKPGTEKEESEVLNEKGMNTE